MAQIDTLIEDIGLLFTQEINTKLLEKAAKNLSKDVRAVVIEKLNQDKKEFTLRFSNIGTPCVRKLYLEKNYPNDKIPLTVSSRIKFQFGDLTEEYLLFLAELAGHTVELRQQTVEIGGIQGHWDAVIDGVLVDCKSASSFSFKKFKEGLTPETDTFGYLVQLGSYHYAGLKAGFDIDPDRFAFLAFDKQHGHICLDIHQADKDKDWEAFFSERKEIVNGDELPPRKYDAVPEGKSGNMKLDTVCSYCDMKNKCWPGLRTFAYSYGPVFLTKVAREPNVPEIKGEITEQETKETS